MAFATLEIEHGIALIWIDQAGQKVNKLSLELIDEFDALISQIETDSNIGAAVLISRKEDSFIAGADIEQFLGMAGTGQAAVMSRRGNQLLQRLATLATPTVAAINGAALGGGLEVALACDYRIITDHPKTQLGLPEVQLGLLPAGGGTQRLPRLIGLQRALGLLLTGKNVYPRQALRLRLADVLTPAPNLLSTARQVAERLSKEGSLGRRPRPPWWSRLLESSRPGRSLILKAAARSAGKKTRGNYPAPERILECVRVGLNRGLEAGFEDEARAFEDLMASPESRQLVNLFFALNRSKKHPAPGLARKVDRLAVLGAGLMGSGIVEVSSNFGYSVILKDIQEAALARAKRGIWRSASLKVKKRVISQFTRDQLLSRIQLTTDYELLANCQLVIEAVFEDLHLKQTVLRDVETVTSPNCIFASNTSALPISSIAEASRRPSTVIGMHYFSPVQKMPLLEIIATPKTEDWVVATARQVGLDQGKTVIVVKDGPGFYTTRVLAPMLNEALEILSEGNSIEAIDGALKNWGFPIGPLGLIDEVGIDVAAHVTEVLSDLFAEQGVQPVNRGRVLMDAGLLGKKGGKGFYSYTQGKKKVNPEIYPLIRAGGRRQLPVDQIQERLSLQFVNQAVLCLQEEILASPEDGDLGAVLGLGFPPFRGGPFRHIDAVGASEIIRQLEKWRKEHGDRFRPAQMLLDRARNDVSFSA